ncbi:hypothetical protein ACLS0F_11245 [Avibacterium endocarditidis]
MSFFHSLQHLYAMAISHHKTNQHRAEQYFILAKNCNSLILGKSYEKGGKDFYLMPCHYGIKGDICHIVASMAEK